MMRLLVTGSRDWDHLDSINAVLAHYARDCLGRAEKAGIPLLRVTWGERELVAPEWLAQNAPELVA